MLRLVRATTVRRTGRRDGGAPFGYAQGRPRCALPTRARGLRVGRMAGRVAGFTLVEVLLTLVVLMIGIYAMLRIFPRGYSTIQMAQQRTVAAHLAEEELNRWRLHPEALPDAIVATDYTGALIPSTLTNNSQNLTQLLIYGEVAAQVPGTETYESWQVPPLTLPLLDRIGRPLIYSPNDLTPSQCDAVLGFEGLSNHVVVHPNWQPNSLYLPRTVLGEQIDIARLGTNAQGVLFYLLSHAPLDILRYDGVDDPGTPGIDERTRVYVDVYDARPWRYLPSPLDRPLAGQEFTYDLGTRQLTFGPATPPAYERKFKVDLTCTDPDDPALRIRVFGFTVTVPQNSSVGTEPLLEGTDPTTIQVHELMEEVADPNLLLDLGPAARRNIYYVDTQTRITGQIRFPLVLQVQPRPDDIAVAKVDYRVLDWQVLAFDVEVPPDGVVSLPVRALKGSGYINPPRQDRAQPVARGIKKFYDVNGNELPASPASAADAYVVAVDLQNGEVLTESELTIGLSASPRERLTRFRVDHRMGRLYFNYGEWEVGSFGPDEAASSMGVAPRRVYSRNGRTYRVFCRAEGDWAVQFSMAARLYARSKTGLPGGGPVAGGDDTRLTYAWRYDPEPAERHQVYFPLSEIGQVVAVDYYRADTGAYVSGEVHNVVGPDIKELGEWVGWLSSGGLTYAPNEWGPVTVRGLSVRARVSWVTQGAGSSLQDWVVAKKREVQTELPQPVPRSLQESWHQMTVTTYLTRVPL